MASFPGAIKSFATRSPGQVIQSATTNDLQDEITAIETALITGPVTLPISTLGALSVTGGSTLATLSVTGGSTLATLSVTGGSTFAGAVTLGAGIASTTSFASSATFSSGVTISSGGLVLSTGLLTLNQGQIVFPATQVPSAGANVLDDYEENTWTPVLGGAGGTSGQTYTLQQGYYLKIGQLVVAHFYVVLSAKGTITGNVQIQGLPFTCANIMNAMPVALYFASLATNWISVLASVAANTTTAAVVGNQAAATTNTTALGTADIANNTLISGVLIYRASA